MIRDNITKQIGEALKAKDELRLTTLRILSSALNYENIAKQHDLSEEEEIVVVRREIKKREDAVSAYEQAKGKLTSHTDADLNQRIDKERKEIEVLSQYLPAEIPLSELNKIIEEAISTTGASEIKDMGRVIAQVKEKTKGAASGQKIAEIVKSKLS